MSGTVKNVGHQQRNYPTSQLEAQKIECNVLSSLIPYFKYRTKSLQNSTGLLKLNIKFYALIYLRRDNNLHALQKLNNHYSFALPVSLSI